MRFCETSHLYGYGGIQNARKTVPNQSSYLADSGTTQGVTKAANSGTDNTIVNSFQSLTQKAIHGMINAPNPKKIAVPIFATNVRHCGPTYSSAVQLIWNKLECFTVL